MLLSYLFVRKSLIASTLICERGFHQEKEGLGEGGVGRSLGSAIPLQGTGHIVRDRRQSVRI